MSPRTPRKTKHKFINWTEIITMSFYWLCFFRVRNFGKRYSDHWHWRIRKVGFIRSISQKTEYKRSPDNPKRWRVCISCGRWFSKIIRKKLRIPRTHSETGIYRKESISAENLMAIGKSFNLKKRKMTKESIRIFGLTQKLRKNFNCRHHVEPRSSIVRAEETVKSLSTELLWCHQVNLCRSGDCTREHMFDYVDVDANRNLSDSWTSFTRFTVIERNSSEKKYTMREEDWRKAKTSEAKTNSIILILQGSGRSSVLYYDFAHEFVPMKRSQESSVKASTCCLVSRHGVSVRQKFFE